MTKNDLIKMLLSGADAVIENKEKINSINVFPVPDADTGSNMANTFLGIKNALEKDVSKNNLDFYNSVSDAALSFSQGNSGIMIAGFITGFLKKIISEEISINDLKKGFEDGAISARNSVESPKEGTMLDVMDTFCEEFAKNELHDKALISVKASLINTESKMKVLSDNHVVDAGALGFVIFIYGFFGENFDFSGIDMSPTKTEKSDFGDYPYEVVFIVEFAEFGLDDIKNMFHPLGESLDIIKVEDKIKVHIHTKEPTLVVETAKLLGNVESIKTVDMRNGAWHN